jgi:uncharacterized protein with PIN domain
MECNGVICSVSKDEIRALTDPEIFDRFDAFWQCGNCQKIYWQGTHYTRMLERIKCINPS